MLWGVGGIFGYAAFGFIADGWAAAGDRALQCRHAGRWPDLLPERRTFGCSLSCCRLRLFRVRGFSGHAVYLPELFPTHVRSTAVSFCNGTGQIITSFGR